MISGTGRIDLPALLTAAKSIQDALDMHGIANCLIGGLALQRWGEPRYTKDADMTIVCPVGDEDRTIGLLLGIATPRMSNAAEFARERRVYLGSVGAVGIDISLGATGFESRMIEAATQFEFLPGLNLRTCSAESLVVLKTFANRGQDWVDLENIVLRQYGKLEWDTIERELIPLLELKEEPELLQRLKTLDAKAATFLSTPLSPS
ncbi:MAG: nucleotidyl transferase AbiEii/AbiGii toxin family protein [Betaproteobacteria bacterium]|nr:nucleotidyl transferase AbiEii/AbiGii toxin family protein [Betaproteobacteria bacterium]